MTPRGPAGQSLGADSHRHVIMVVIGLAAVRRLLRDRHTHEVVIVVVIGLAAATRLLRDSQSRSFARLASWDKRPKLTEVRVIKARRA